MVRLLLQMRAVAALLPLTVLLLSAQAAAVSSQASPPCAACLAVAIVPPQVELLPASLHGLSVLVRVSPTTIDTAADVLESIAGRGGRPGLLVAGLPDAPPAGRTLRDLRVLVIDVRTVPASDDRLAYDLKQRLTAVRSVAGDIEIGVAAASDRLRELLARDVAAYVDFVVRDGEADIPREGHEWRAGGALVDLGAALARTRAEGADRWLWHLPEELERPSFVFEELARAAAILTPGLVPATDVRVSCDGRPAAVYLNPVSLEHVAWAEACGADAAISVQPEEAVPDRVALSRGMLIRIALARPDRFAEGVAVTTGRTLTVEEILARHQAAAAGQSARLRTLVSAGTLTVTFEAPGFPAPVTIGSATVMFTDRERTELAHTDIRVNGITFTSTGVPRLPILEPERVASPPLAIALTDEYHYRLTGEATIDGIHCYVVLFEPIARGRSLFRGRAWIAADTFGLVRTEAHQTDLRGVIVASEQTDEFTRTADGLWLLARSDVRQVYQGATHRTPIQRLLVLSGHDVNPPDFEARRSRAHASDAVMLRDTPRGYRYLRRTAPDSRRGPDSSPAREVEQAVGYVRTLALGTIIDPNITRPLPFAGLSYIDFDLFGTGAQFNGFFGGSYGQLAVSAPSLGGSRWQLAANAFGIAASYNDREFVAGREEYSRNIRQRPAHLSVSLLRPLSSRLSFRAGYDLDYTHFASGDQTASDFRVPAHQVVHGLTLALEAQRAGWEMRGWWSPARRSGWREWGCPDIADFDPRHRDFQRYGGSLSRSVVVTPVLVFRGEAALMAGRDLDRFSRYAFGSFDNRLHGYPSALIRYDRGAVVRAAAAWSALRALRIDGFFDAASVRDRGFGPGATTFIGFGTAIEGPAPFGTLAAVEWGYGVQGIDTDGGRGTHVIRITAYKMF